MEQTALRISQSVITTINALPEAERNAIATALAKDYILGEDPRASLNPTLMMVYTFIKFRVDKDCRCG